MSTIDSWKIQYSVNISHSELVYPLPAPVVFFRFIDLFAVRAYAERLNHSVGYSAFLTVLLPTLTAPIQLIITHLSTAAIASAQFDYPLNSYSSLL